MENTPKIAPVEQAPEPKEIKKTKKKKAESLGSFAVEPQHEKPKDDADKPSFWQKPEKSKPADEASPEIEQPALAEEANITAPLEHLSDEERQFAVQSLVEASQLQEPEPMLSDEAAVTAAEAIAQFRAAIVENGQDLDAAEADVLQDLGVETVADDAPRIAAEDTSVALEAGPENDNEGPLEFDETPVELNAPEASPDEEPDDPDNPAHTSAVPSGAASGSGASGGTGGGGGRNGGGGPTPPTGPLLPPGGGPPPGPGVVPVAAFNPNMAPPAAVTPPTEVIIDRGNTAGAALVGGIIGYFIGRRRGRIKTEKRLLPIQKKLQKEVTDLQFQIQTKEANIRKLAIRQVQAGNKPVKLQQSAERPAPVIRSNSPEKPVEHTPRPNLPVTRIERPSAPQKPRVAEARVLPLQLKPEAPTHLGHMVITAEAQPVRVAVQEKLPAQKSQSAEKPLLAEKQVTTLNRAELLRLSERIIVDGASLRQIYESRLVGEKGLRRLVQEHLRGGDLKKALRREIVEREIDFERDPILRDHASSGQEPAAGGRSGNATALQQMLQQADVDLHSDKEEIAFLKARASHEERQQNRDDKRRKAMDVSLVTTIVVLVSMLVIIGIMHR